MNEVPACKDFARDLFQDNNSESNLLYFNLGKLLYSPFFFSRIDTFESSGNYLEPWFVWPVPSECHRCLFRCLHCLSQQWKIHVKSIPLKNCLTFYLAKYTVTPLFSTTTTDMFLYDVLKLFPRWPLVFQSSPLPPLAARDVVTPNKINMCNLLRNCSFVPKQSCVTTPNNTYDENYSIRRGHGKK